MTYRCSTQRKHDPLGWEAWSELWGVYEWSIGVSWRDDDLLTSRGPPTNRCRGRCGTWASNVSTPCAPSLSSVYTGATVVYTMGLRTGEMQAAWQEFGTGL
jgi:hypothetical protein